MCVILSMLFVLTSCSLLPDSGDRSERQAFTHREETRAEETLRRNPFKPRNYDTGNTVKVVLLRLCRLF